MTVRIDGALIVDEGGKYIFTKQCLHCKGVTTITTDANKFHRWHVEMKLIQDVWPHLAAGEREQMMTGMHDECWAEIFPPDIEDDDELIAISDADYS